MSAIEPPFSLGTVPKPTASLPTSNIKTLHAALCKKRTAALLTYITDYDILCLIMNLEQIFLGKFSKMVDLGTVFALSLSLSLSLSRICLNNFFTFFQKLPGIHSMWVYRFFYLSADLRIGDSL
jgi:hypothetical protein